MSAFGAHVQIQHIFIIIEIRFFGKTLLQFYTIYVKYTFTVLKTEVKLVFG